MNELDTSKSIGIIAQNIGTWPSITTDGAYTTSVTTHTIKGEMCVASITLSEFEVMTISKDEIRNKLAEKLVKEIYNKIEFTSQDDMMSGNKTIRGRVFVVPSSDVQLLRKSGY